MKVSVIFSSHWLGFYFFIFIFKLWHVIEFNVPSTLIDTGLVLNIKNY